MTTENDTTLCRYHGYWMAFIIIVLFGNFGDSEFDLYDAIIKALLK